MKYFILAGLLCLSAAAFAQSDPQKILSEFFKLYEQKDSDLALDYLFGTNKWMDGSREQIDNVKFQLSSTVVRAMGQYYGHDLVTKKSVGDNLAFYSYLIRYDRQPIRFNFLFYSPDGNTWRLQNFSFDDKIKDELDEAVKFYRLEANMRY